MEPIYPNIKVDLSTGSGNAVHIISKVARAMRVAKVRPENLNTFLDEVKQGDYDHVLQICKKYVGVENG